MAKYARLQQLLKNNPEIDLSFYPGQLLHLRTFLADWVESNKFLEAYSDPETSDESCKALLEETIVLLQDKAKQNQVPGLDLVIRTIVTELKKTYEAQPGKFVEDLVKGLLREDQLFSSENMATLPMTVDGASAVMNAAELSQLITQSQGLQETMIKLVNAGASLLLNFEADIVSQSPIPKDVFGNGQRIEPPHVVFTKLKNRLMACIPKILDDVKRVIFELRAHIKLWKTHQLHQCVGREPEGASGETPAYVEQMCHQVCHVVTCLWRCAVSNELQRVDSVRDVNSSHGIAVSSLARFVGEVRQLIISIFEHFLVVIEQPPLTMMIEKEKGAKDKTDDTNSSKKFKTTVGLLGGEGLKDLGLQMLEVEIYLAHNQDLAKHLPKNQRPPEFFKILCDKPSRRGASKSYDSPKLPYQRTYENLRVEGYRRSENKNVYKQLYHVVYNIKFQIPMPVTVEFSSTTYSLPIIVRTGAVQASEHVGVLLWHSFSSSNMYNLNADIASTMTVEQVIQMINERLIFIGGRGLQTYECQFLRDRIRMAINPRGDQRTVQDSISLDAFVKDKVWLPTQGKPGEKDVMTFSLWRWIHAVLNLLESTLRQPWLDGMIYGFASRDHCEQVLQNEPDGTFLMRFSESSLSGNYIMAKGGLAVVVKIGGKVGYPPPLKPEEIENEGLGKLICNIRNTDRNQCMILFGTNVDVEELKQRYPSGTPPDCDLQRRYLGWEKNGVIEPQNTDYNVASPAHMGSPHPNGPTSVGSQQDGRKKPKSAKRKKNAKQEPAISTKQYRNVPPMSPESTTSSVASPMSMPMSPPNSGFQPVGILQRQMSSSSYGSPPTPTNIPTTVLSQMTLNGGGEIDNQGQQPMMELELAPGFFVVGDSEGGGEQVIIYSDGISASAVSAPGSADLPVSSSGPTTVACPVSNQTPSNFLYGNPMMVSQFGTEEITIEDLQQLGDLQQFEGVGGVNMQGQVQ